ncbi:MULTISPECIES: [protein-PII] uridylyltransferase [unclassified Rhodanobacter]|uniref:[protein-PII] uridylyltransferase n=1 Tax=unclassified Rhodanobacter TaxID=2621553 RepID=UPI0007A99996|nr:MULTISPECIES: [protein-PII] uridylyltransferase [unclassified Rhodanobacter]KZC16522.1 bifunctional uridylyltransferase/uridylyl-removing protein [Rhodanobacter sp. FW104-R8]KZC25937.1 bifunctional uridylyltransferase/uridylyl-removing protein [Rhodanobacter sp. FW510-T8]KZC31536.1 bifunctional uridylyltransferase/uridylyl-removing protein [Rhodanobacter sp. FW510-R10]
MPTGSPVLPPLPRLPAAVPRSGVSADARRALRQLLGDVDRALATAFRDGADASMLARRRGESVDRVVAHVWTACLGDVTGAALFAVGGYGRGLLFPYSDVDLLALVQAPEPARRRALEQFFATLWDIGLKVGHAVRDPAQCRTLAAQDASVFTSLLDARRLAGDPAFDTRLRAVVDDPALWPAPAYLAARLAERDARHARFDDTAYNLEPNLKDGPGGLRTLDSLRWLGRRLAHAGELADMVAEGLLDPAEQSALEQSEATLRRYRYALHLEAGRPEERLLFDYQRALAARLGFEDEHERNLGVEQFMQGYYRAASQVERLGMQVAERFVEMLEPPGEAVPVGADFIRYGKRLAARDPQLFMRRPAALVEIFIARLDQPGVVGFSADTMRRIHQATAAHGDALADDGEVLAAFLQLLRRGAPAVEALWRMNRHGLLAAILPAFGKVFGRMQYDLFHVYTVDEHTLRVLRNLARFADPAAKREFPLGCEIWHGLPAPEVMLLAGLFHDIAKGRGGDHSVLGAEDARAFCSRLGLPPADVERVAWLVRWHLLMSTTAQRQDITDPDVVHRFADVVGSRERLGQLYLLTVADIIGTSPRLWNGWKDRLLADLCTSTRYALRSDVELPRDIGARARECSEYALALLLNEGHAEADVVRVWADFPQLSFLRHRPEQIAWQTAAILRAQGALPLVAVHPLSVRGSTELFVYTPDRDGLFATITAVLDRLRFSVLEARILSSPTGMALDTLLLLDADSQQPVSAARAEELQQRLQRALAQSAGVQPSKRGMSRHQKHFQMTPQISFHAAGGRTQLALIGADRPGLLAAVAQVMLATGVRVHDARIATFGERVEDFFQLTDRHDAPLDEALQGRLLQALLERIGPARD